MMPGPRRSFGAFAWLAATWLVVMVCGAAAYPLLTSAFHQFSSDEVHPCLANRPPGALAVPRRTARLRSDSPPFEQVARFAASTASVGCHEHRQSSPQPRPGGERGEERGASRRLEVTARDVSRYMRHARCATFDTDGDTVLDRKEFEAVPQAGGRRLRRQRFDARVARGAPGLSFDEALVCEVFPESEASAWLQRYDRDGSRTLSRDEYRGIPELRRYVLGSDALGRDVFVRTLAGARISLFVGLMGTMLSVLIGVLWGATAGFVGGRADDAMMRVVDVLYGLPYMFIVILLTVVFGRSLLILVLAIGSVSWLTMARIVRGRVLETVGESYVEAAVALGAKGRRVLVRHVIPQTREVVLTFAALTMPTVMLQEAFLSFLGLGVQPPLTSWGAMASDASSMTVIVYYPWQILAPGLAFTVTLLALNLLADRFSAQRPK